LERDNQEPIPGLVGRQSSFVETLPQSIRYASALKKGDHMVLFYDNLVVAAEYLSAFIDAAIELHEPTCFVGLSHRQYETMFDQVGIRINELENGGYLKHIPTEDFLLQDGSFSKERMLENIEKLLTTTSESDSREFRFIIMNPPSDGRMKVPEIMELERALEGLRQRPICVICCYPSEKTIIDEPKPYFLLELLRSHNHCLFQGVGISTIDLMDKFGQIPTLRAETPDG